MLRLLCSRYLFCYHKVFCRLFLEKYREEFHKEFLWEEENALPNRNHKFWLYSKLKMDLLHGAECFKAWDLYELYHFYEDITQLSKLVLSTISLTFNWLSHVFSNNDKDCLQDKVQAPSKLNPHLQRNYKFWLSLDGQQSFVFWPHVLAVGNVFHLKYFCKLIL